MVAQRVGRGEQTDERRHALLATPADEQVECRQLDGLVLVAHGAEERELGALSRKAREHPARGPPYRGDAMAAEIERCRLEPRAGAALEHGQHQQQGLDRARGRGERQQHVQRLGRHAAERVGRGGPLDGLAVPEPVDQGGDHLRVLERAERAAGGGAHRCRVVEHPAHDDRQILRIVRSDQQRAPADRRDPRVRPDRAAPPTRGCRAAARGLPPSCRCRDGPRTPAATGRAAGAGRRPPRPPPPGAGCRRPGSARRRRSRPAARPSPRSSPESRRGSPARCRGRPARGRPARSSPPLPVRRGACRSPRRWPRESSPATRARDRPGAARAGARAPPAPRSSGAPARPGRRRGCRGRGRAADPRPPARRSHPARRSPRAGATDSGRACRAGRARPRRRGAGRALRWRPAPHWRPGGGAGAGSRAPSGCSRSGRAPAARTSRLRGSRRRASARGTAPRTGPAAPARRSPRSGAPR